MEDNVYVIEGHPENWEEAIKLTSDVLYEEGCVHEDFFNQCRKRELKYPTGLDTLVPVAIPHTDAANVIKTAACMMRLQEPVKFKSMENSEEEIAVDFVLNLAVNDSGIQLKTLQATIILFQSEEFKRNFWSYTLEELKAKFVDIWGRVG